VTTAYAPVLADVVPTCEDLLLPSAVAAYLVDRLRAGEADALSGSSLRHPDTGELVGLAEIRITLEDARVFPLLLQIKTVAVAFTPRYAHACVRSYA
jgi:hypothetical protein